MSEDNTPSELDLLKKRADQMGLKYHHKIGAVKLNKLIQEKMGQETVEETFPEEELSVANPTPTYAPNVPKRSPLKETKGQRKVRLRKESSKLVRIRVVCMNPAMKDYEGQMYTAGNGVIGFFTKFIQFNTDEGWHVPNILYKHMKERKCQVFHTVKGPRGNKIRKGKLINELSIEVLPPLTGKEMNELARKQAMANNLD